jgi:hypothetical protein
MNHDVVITCADTRVSRSPDCLVAPEQIARVPAQACQRLSLS